MSVSKIVTSAVMALSLVAVPTLASAAPAASKLSVTSARTAAPATKGQKAAGGSSLIIAGLAGIAVIVGIIIAADSGKSVSR